jgi:hypothetical protein
MISTLLAEPTGPDRRATIRVSRPPRLDPPYDDERAAMTARKPSPPPPAAPPTTPAAPEPAPGMSSAGRIAMAYVRLCVEVLNGYRSPSHLRRIAGPVEFADVIEQIRQRHNARGHFLAHGRALNERADASPESARGPRNPAAPAFARSGLNRSGMHRPDPTIPTGFTLTRLRVSEPRDGAAEVVAVLSKSGMSLAVAIRLERTDGTWTCTVVQVV